MRLLVVALGMVAIVSLTSSTVESQSRVKPRPKQGSICVADVLPPNSGEKSLGNPSGGNRISTYSIQVDKKAPVIALSARAVEISGLSPDRKHLVKIYGDGKLVESFWFRFDSYSTKTLCLWFNELYETWSLWDAKDGGLKCRCG